MTQLQNPIKRLTGISERFVFCALALTVLVANLNAKSLDINDLNFSQMIKGSPELTLRTLGRPWGETYQRGKLYRPMAMPKLKLSQPAIAPKVAGSYAIGKVKMKQSQFNKFVIEPAAGLIVGRLLTRIVAAKTQRYSTDAPLEVTLAKWIGTSAGVVAAPVHGYLRDKIGPGKSLVVTTIGTSLATLAVVSVFVGRRVTFKVAPFFGLSAAVGAFAGAAATETIRRANGL